MRYEPLDSEVFVENRRRLAELLPRKSLAVVNANDLLPTNADGSMPFYQNSDLYYLSGIDQEETVLFLFPDAFEEENREILFVRETSELLAIWEGAKLTKSEASAASGIGKVCWLGELDAHLRSLGLEAENLYLNTNEHRRGNDRVETREMRFVHRCKREFPLHRFSRLAPLISGLRSIKSEAEVATLRKACEITREGFLRSLNFIKPGVMEYEIEAEFAHEFLRSGSRGFAYNPIIASGKNACVLHYLDNDQRCHDGDILLMDVAAEYANYNADMTRSVPVGGRFTSRQRSVYDAVLRVMNGAAEILRPGVLIADYQKEVGKIVEGELIDLGLLEKSKVNDQDPKNPLFRKYFMHGTSHHLGLDVHDVGAPERLVEVGMVFTVEPGIYIPDEELGIRLENDYVIGEEENVDLMADIPVEAEEIEDLMNL